MSSILSTSNEDLLMLFTNLLYMDNMGLKYIKTKLLQS